MNEEETIEVPAEEIMQYRRDKVKKCLQSALGFLSIKIEPKYAEALEKVEEAAEILKTMG